MMHPTPSANTVPPAQTLLHGLPSYTPSTTTISNSGYRSIPTTSSISNSKDISETLSKLNETINIICRRLEKLEAAIVTQDQAVESMRKFEEATTSNIEKLADIIQKLSRQVVQTV